MKLSVGLCILHLYAVHTGILHTDTLLWEAKSSDLLQYSVMRRQNNSGPVTELQWRSCSKALRS